MWNSRPVRIFWIGSMFFSIGVNNCLGYWLGLRRWELLSLAAVFFVVAVISWGLERRKQMYSVPYAVTVTVLLIAQIPMMAHATGCILPLILAATVEVLLSIGISACIVWRNRHRSRSHE